MKHRLNPKAEEEFIRFISFGFVCIRALAQSGNVESCREIADLLHNFDDIIRSKNAKSLENLLEHIERQTVDSPLYGFKTISSHAREEIKRLL
jgi:hypothetical protein